MTQLERIAMFVAAARPRHLTVDIRQLFKRNTLDSLGCAIAALSGQPFQALREQFVVKEQRGYEGGLTNPVSWDRTVEKFHWLSEPFVDEDLRGRLIEAVQELDVRRVANLMDLLAQVRPAAVYPATHPGIQ